MVEALFTLALIAIAIGSGIYAASEWLNGSRIRAFWSLMLVVASLLCAVLVSVAL